MDEVLRSWVRKIDDLKERNRDKRLINHQALVCPPDTLVITDTKNVGLHEREKKEGSVHNVKGQENGGRDILVGTNRSEI